MRRRLTKSMENEFENTGREDTTRGKMKIVRGIDLDEVLVNFVPHFLDYVQPIIGKMVYTDELKSYNFWEHGVGKDREEAVNLVDGFFESGLARALSVTDGAQEAVRDFLEEGEVFVVTARPWRYSRETNYLIKKNFPGLEGRIIYSSDFHGGEKTKSEICTEIGAIYFYEDNIRYAKECARNVKNVYLFDRPWNQEAVNGNIIRVKGWRDILRRENES